MPFSTTRWGVQNAAFGRRSLLSTGPRAQAPRPGPRGLASRRGRGAFLAAVLGCAAVLSSPALASPAVYYVAPPPAGSDANVGTDPAPWATLQRAAGQVGAGDTVIVRAGTYAGFVLGWDFPQNGTSASPITFHADPGVKINVRNAKTPDGINLEGASYIVIEGFRVESVPRAGIRSVVNTGVVIRNNTCDSNGTWGILTGFSDNILIENNVTSRSGTQHGIYVSNSCVNPVVRRNVVWGNFANGLHFNGDVSQGGVGVITGALVERNVIFDNGAGGGSGINCDGVQSSVFRNNLLYGNHASGISLYQIDASAGAKNNVVVNNTIVMAADARWAVNIKNGSTGNTVSNNILYNLHPARGSINIVADSLPGFTSHHNVVMSRFSADDGDTVLTLAQWRVATGQDATSVLSDPAALFVNPPAGDYHLTGTSPAIDLGAAASAPLSDLDGRRRPVGAGWDAGAYEFGGQAADFNADGRLDILWRNGATGENTVWLMNRMTSTAAAALPPVFDLNWKMTGSGDFDGDGKSDILWRNAVTGENVIWKMNGTAVAALVALPPVFDLNWRIAGVADFDGDGKPDILWRHGGNGQNLVWRMNGTSVGSLAPLPAVSDIGWQLAATADFNGDGSPDLLWRHAITGQNTIWLLSGTAVIGQAALPPVADGNWTIGGAGDFNGDGSPDILWRNGATGADTAWLLTGTSVTTAAAIPAVLDLNWKISSPK
ncbi:MAG: FG-GAP-like repeat-containing protein [Acidobacteriota bacterium]